MATTNSPPEPEPHSLAAAEQALVEIAQALPGPARIRLLPQVDTITHVLKALWKETGLRDGLRHKTL